MNHKKNYPLSIHSQFGILQGNVIAHSPSYFELWELDQYSPLTLGWLIQIILYLISWDLMVHFSATSSTTVINQNFGSSLSTKAMF